MLKIGVLVSGGGTNLQAIIDEIEKGKLSAEIVTVVSSNPKAYAIVRCENHNINSAVINPKDFETKILYERKLTEHFKNLKVDLIVLAGFIIILSKDFVNKFKIINIHPSLIPSFCGEGFYGLKVHEAVLKRGVKITGATVHFVDEGTDTGEIILQKEVYVKEDDTPEVLQKRVMEEAEWIIYPKAIKLISEKYFNN